MSRCFILAWLDGRGSRRSVEAMSQIHLFEEVTHLEPDYFISGTPDLPDPYDSGWERYRYFFQLPEYRAPIAKLIDPVVELVLCNPVEDGWTTNVVQFPEGGRYGYQPPEAA